MPHLGAFLLEGNTDSIKFWYTEGEQEIMEGALG